MAKPFVRDDREGKSLHFSLDELQSRMDPRKPWQLEVDYTLTMMGFLMLQPAPRRIAMIGLGGGSLAKFCYRHLPQARFTVVEINPHVIALRREFAIPDDDARFEVIEADGAAFVAAQATGVGGLDVLLVDGFDQDGQPEALCSQAFYDNCHAALAPGGVLAVNLHHDDAAYALWAGRLQRSFGGQALEVPAQEKSNCIVLASKGGHPGPSLKAGLKLLNAEARQQLRPEFTRMLWSLKEPT